MRASTFKQQNLDVLCAVMSLCEFGLMRIMSHVLQACTLARRNAEVFLKYIHRNNVSMPGATSHARGPEQQVKGQFCRHQKRNLPASKLCASAVLAAQKELLPFL